MSILAGIKREEKKVKKELGKLQHQLSGLQPAAKALGDSASGDSRESRNVSCPRPVGRKFRKPQDYAGPRSRRRQRRSRAKVVLRVYSGRCRSTGT